MDETEKLIKIQVAEVTLPVATAASIQEVAVTLDSKYDRCIGIALYEISDGDNAFYQVGLADNNSQLVDLMVSDLLQVNTAVAPDDKFLSVNFQRRDGQNLKIQILPDSIVATDAINFILHFKLIRDTPYEA